MTQWSTVNGMGEMSETSGDASSVGLDMVLVENMHIGRTVLVVDQIRAQARTLVLVRVQVQPALMGQVNLI